MWEQNKNQCDPDHSFKVVRYTKPVFFSKLLSWPMMAAVWCSQRPQTPMLLAVVFPHGHSAGLSAPLVSLSPVSPGLWYKASLSPVTSLMRVHNAESVLQIFDTFKVSGTRWDIGIWWQIRRNDEKLKSSTNLTNFHCVCFVYTVTLTIWWTLCFDASQTVTVIFLWLIF